VWMALGLTPRCEGNEQQRIIYDDLCEPAFNVVEGEVSSTYFYEQSRNVSWKMNNSYLRRYLWMRGCQGVRTFFYETYLEDTDEVRTVMNGQSHVEINKRDSVAWYEIDIREDQGKFLLQTWASVLALKPELCPEQTAESLAWPGVEHPVSREIANRISEIVYFDDKLLEKYEQNYQFKCIPYQYYESWIHCPSYHGRWAFAGFRRVGRNLLKAEVKDIYKGVPDSQILHAHKYVMSIDEARGYDANEEHMPSKVKRFVDVFLCLGDMLSRLGSSVKIDCSGADIIQIDKYVLRDSGMSAYPIICKLAHVVPLEMTQQEFLARCKILHEIISRINEGFLNSLVQCAGCKPHSISKFRSLKLLQVVLNIVADLNRRGKEVSAFMSDDEPDNWKENNSKLAAIFINNDLRIVDAHMTNECLQKLQRLGFDTASVNSGYGKAMDFIMDSVIKSLEFLVSQIIILLKRKYRA